MISFPDDVLNAKLGDVFSSFLDLCGEVGADVEIVREYAGQWKAARKGKTKGNLLRLCEDRWQSSLGNGSVPDYGVYGEDWYLGEAWCCWAEYSRKYLRGIASKGSMPDGASILSSLSEVDTVVDLGCGPGLTTSVLKRLFPGSNVWGTNLPGTAQTRMAEVLGDRFGFSVVSGLVDVGRSCLVFASEYFEHFQSPLEHLSDVLDLEPTALLVANAFGTSAVGYFDLYRVDQSGLFNLMLPGRAVSTEFNQQLRNRGYHKVKTNLWNGRPSYWRRVD